MTRRILVALVLAVAFVPQEARAQLDPILYLKDRQPNVIFAVDTANRMQRDHNNDFRDDNVYKKVGGTSAAWEAALGITSGNTLSYYRRKYVGLVNVDQGAGSDKFEADHIEIVGDLDPAYADFEKRTRISIARQALAEALNRNSSVARFGLMRMRQNNPRYLTPPSANSNEWTINEGPVKITSIDAAWALQKVDTEASGTKWNITRPVVDAVNGVVAGPVAPLVAPDAANQNSSVLSILNTATGDASSLLPAGRDSKTVTDAPIDLMLEDAKTEAARLITADTQCRNTVVVLVVGGSRGNTSASDPAMIALQFVNVANGHRVPIYVIAVAPAVGFDEAQLQAIATNSGGQYTKITAAMVDATPVGQPVPELVYATNRAVQHAFTSQSACDAGLSTEHQTTSPIVGTVNLVNAKDITGIALPNTDITNPKTGAKIPQRSNLLVTSGFSLPGFDGKMRAFRTYKPVADSSKSSGYKFVQDGTRLWVASTPAAASRNIYTSLPNGSLVAFTAANASLLLPYLYPANLHPTAAVADATTLIEFIRSQPLGAIVDSTPAIMDPPSLDPPPDSDYPGFASANKDRRTMIWVGANDGMFHGIDGRLGVEVWAFVPFNLLPKLHTLRSGQPVGDFRFFVDGSPKIADVKVDGAWRTYLIMGEGPGGTFYQTFDVTLPNMAGTVTPESDVAATVLTYFAVPGNVPLKWTFPKYSNFDVTIAPYGDISAAAPAVEKTVGETWSDPAVGQVLSPSGPFTVLTGSGFLKYSLQQQTNRGDVVAGTTFYLLDVKTGDVFASQSVGSDGLAETVDNCAAANNCEQIKNAIQADPVATGPPDSRYITKAYIGDLDGRLWRFDIGLNALLKPEFTTTTPTLMYNAGAAQPMFTSMATVNVGGTQQHLFQGTGSELLPSNGVIEAYKLLVVLDNGGSGTKTTEILLQTTDGAAGDEKVTAFPAVAGDIVFFATTTFKPTVFCTPNVDANLYAFTFIGGAAYDTDNSGNITKTDTTRVRTAAGARASAPFIVDQHLVFAAGDKVEMFGEAEDYNNGVGQVGVRILSWREVR